MDTFGAGWICLRPRRIPSCHVGHGAVERDDLATKRRAGIGWDLVPHRRLGPDCGERHDKAGAAGGGCGRTAEREVGEWDAPCASAGRDANEDREGAVADGVDGHGSAGIRVADGGDDHGAPANITRKLAGMSGGSPPSVTSQRAAEHASDVSAVRTTSFAPGRQPGVPVRTRMEDAAGAEGGLANERVMLWRAEAALGGSATSGTLASDTTKNTSGTPPGVGPKAPDDKPGHPRASGTRPRAGRGRR